MHKMEQNKVLEYFDFLQSLADAAAKITLSHFRQKVHVENKNSQTNKIDPVTIADQKAEEVIRELILKKYPKHTIIGEEFDTIDGNPNYRWFIDPIDGTKSFISGVPLWGTLIGLEVNNVPELGIIDIPCMNERYLGSHTLKKAIRIKDGVSEDVITSNEKELKNVKFGYTTDEMFDDERSRKVLDKVNGSVGLTRTGGDCFFYTLLSSGYLDLIIENNLKPFDIVPIVPIIIGAGGSISNWDGESMYTDGNIIASCNESVHAQILEVINSVRV